MSAAPIHDAARIYQRPVELLQNLIRFDTTNPPGQERACVAYIQALLDAAGVETQIFACDPARPNLLARLKGRGAAPPLLLYGHVDVVTTANQTWSRAPFGGEVADGFVWGRGALDMKGGVAMMLAAFLRAHAEQTDLPGDLLLLILSDEEAGGDYGAKYMVEQHPDLFKSVQYAIGEFGGFTLHLGSSRLYPIMVSEKQICQTRVTLRGQGGHGSLPVRGGAMAKLARVLQRLDRRRLPVRITPAARQMIEGIAAALPGVPGLLMRQLLNPALTDRILTMLGEKGALFDAVLHNTASPTIIKASDKINVIPEQVVLHIDGRLVPGATPEEWMADLQAVTGVAMDVEVMRFDPGPAAPDMRLFDRLGAILKEADPGAFPVPLVLPAVTDGRFFARLGIQTYGYLPMKLPPDLNFSQLIHAGDERIPVAAVQFGTDAIYQVLQRFG